MFIKLDKRSWIKIEVARGYFQELREARGDAPLPYSTLARWVRTVSANTKQCDVRAPILSAG